MNIHEKLLDNKWPHLGLVLLVHSSEITMIKKAILIMDFKFGSTKLGKLPKSEQIPRHYLKWNNAELTKIGSLLLKKLV